VLAVSLNGFPPTYLELYIQACCSQYEHSTKGKSENVPRNIFLTNPFIFSHVLQHEQKYRATMQPMASMAPPNNPNYSMQVGSHEASTIPGVKLNHAFLEDFYLKVNALDKIRDISWILDYFRTRPDDLVAALEFRYQVAFKKDGSFVKLSQGGAAVNNNNGVNAAAAYQQVRNDDFVRDLARASGVQARNVQPMFVTQAPPSGMATLRVPQDGYAPARGDTMRQTAAFDYEF
jgi:hypothetical protein